ncbi:tetratricopeptide repeat protein [Variovorax sp. J22P168]|uniref:tetratricopeptide repeat protein n=1 Tax=Variovorax jilinensis TaxID=3053513 RepID=UPI00257612B5|nr:tetratricopeptide repeat protein [Variovorax sp. J22P168]MDM0015652.1 tetratricopeptide repeat protein [Variovorax sp. J22P168]
MRMARWRRCAVLAACALAAVLAGCSSAPVRSSTEVQALGLNTQGLDRYKAGDLPRSLAFFQQALAVAQSIEDENMIAVARMNIAMVYQKMGRQDEALAQFDAVLAERRLVFASERRAEAAFRRAMVLQASDRAQAVQSLDQALALCGSCALKGKILNLKAYLAIDAGQPQEGLRLAQQAHGALPKDDGLERANALRLQGSALIALKTPAAAISPLEQALVLDKAAGSSEKIFQDLLLLGQASPARSDAARDYWTRAHDVAAAARNDAGVRQVGKLLASP